MAMPGKLEFGLLPDRRMDWRTLATSYGLEIFIILVLLGAGFFFPDTLRLRQRYTVTELIPRPDLKPEPVRPKAKVRHPVVVPKLAPPGSLHVDGWERDQLILIHPMRRAPSSSDRQS